jgi:hypothetical protein
VLAATKLVAIALAVVAAGVLLGRGRESRQRTALATIVAKARQDVTTYVQMPVGDDHSVSMPLSIPVGEASTFDLRVDGLAEPLRAAFSTVNGRDFDVGQRVRVTLQRRGVPPLWTRFVVVDMTPSDSAGA